MADWVKIGTNVVVGGGLGAIDQAVQNQDEKREAEAGEKLPVMKQYGTYFNYGLPIAAIFATAFGALRGEWATRLLVAGSMLAGRKGTWQLTKRKAASVSWKRVAQTEAQRIAALRGGTGTPAPAGVGLEI